MEGLPRQLHTISTDLVSRTRQVHRRGGVVDAVIASARLPVLFAPIPDDSGRLLVDGGILDNLPVDLLTERDEGPVVALARGAIVITPATLGVGLLEFHQMDRMVTAGRAAGRALLDQTGGDLSGRPAEPAELGRTATLR